MSDEPNAGMPVAPPYREAYPTMSMTGMRNAVVNGVKERQWFNEHDELVARLEVLEWTPSYVDVWYEWVEGRVRRTQRSIIDMHHRPTLTGRRQAVASCEGCHAATARLYLVDGRWRCVGCHKLVARASLLSRAEAFLEKARRLSYEVHSRDAPTRGLRTWDRKRIELGMMERELLWGAVDEVRPHLRPMVDGKWVDGVTAVDPEELVSIGYKPAVAAAAQLSVSPWFG